MHVTAAESRLSRASNAWSRFWFAPADPTVLGAIRILTGAITFYTLLVSSFDLQEIVGKNAWVDLSLRQQQYRESPVGKMPFGWNDSGTYRPPSTPEEKEYAANYFARWGTQPPLPYPKNPQEAKSYDDYQMRWGVDPRLLMTTGRYVWSVWFHVTDPVWMGVVQGGFVLCSFLFMIGCGTRVTSVLTWFGALSFIHRAPASLFGVDTMMTVLLLYLMIGPSGAALSVDRLIARWRAKGRGLPAPPLKPLVSASLALRLIQVHTCIIYAAAGTAKLQGTTWWFGTAPWGTIANFEFAPMTIPLYVDLLRLLAKTRWLYEVVMTVGALGTLTFEIGYPFLIWRPAFRTPWLWMAVLMHLGISLLMGLGTFALIMLAFNLAFVSPETVRWVLRKMTPKPWRGAEPVVVPAAEMERSKVPVIVRQEKLPKTVAATQAKRKH